MEVLEKEEHSERDVVEALRDLIWLNGVIATELIQITENTSRALRGDIPEGCREAHGRLREEAIGIVEKHRPDKAADLRRHVLKHD